MSEATEENKEVKNEEDKKEELTEIQNNQNLLKDIISPEKIEQEKKEEPVQQANEEKKEEPVQPPINEEKKEEQPPSTEENKPVLNEIIMDTTNKTLIY